MAEVEKRQPEGKRVLPITILDILQRETDAAHGMEASEIRAVLERDYKLTATEKTIREHCKALQGLAPLGRTVLRLNRGDIGPDGQAISAADAGWAVEPYLDDMQIRLVIDGVSSLSGDADDAEELIEKLLQLAGPHGREDFEACVHVEQQPKSQPDEMQPDEMIDVKVRAASAEMVLDAFANASTKQVGKSDGKLLFEAKFSAAPEIVCQWALLHCDSVEVLKPKKLRRALKSSAKILTALYR